ncbi:23S rRNA (pseudouridine(1915)-N(3))-methyltransferase RlmH [Alkalitalea saponilacus]|uniref:Ribosomal RNA large subunit methyltransferase H n=1 Tax=Alkalitalea saponilacus TaxID=889453 RepID=A0A1T5HT46_9BACT|nr:23S rRNA (pseudouridine(1915)-N(3))-methyltransferase RlmH [Alkalitalea saponilacus]ASB48508.1 23S rRNA (pseudouridine(1915)-N(3))-methyltransferase RlmH [Alkalitalea saponilacus]SKC23869.1 23S rRNA (pseudouridine1915-N3)-methyltransferase [Alkalitalea saponilacus]
MKTYLVMVGRTSDPWLNTGISDYFKRISRYIPFQDIVIPDIKKAKNLSENLLKEKEGEVILKNILPGDVLVILDEKGREFTSRQFAQWMEKQMASGIKNLWFVIGGAYGFSPEVYKRADFKISLSQMTFSHQMVRLFFAEQLYRSLTILNNEPYHHD